MIEVKTLVLGTLDHVWACWTQAEHIQNWNHASDDWHCPKAINGCVEGGRFVFTMAAKDQSFSFDFCGTYTKVIQNQEIAYTMDDDRKAVVSFQAINEGVEITERFDPENQNPTDMQQAGWQMILDNFKKYAESIS